MAAVGEVVNDRQQRKAFKKKTRCEHMLKRDTGINSSDLPSKNVMVCNAGLLTGLEQEVILNVFLPFGTIENVVMMPNKSYCFVVFRDISEAKTAVDALHGKIQKSIQEGPLYLTYTEKVPEAEGIWNYNKLPPGLKIHEEFVTVNEEEIFLNCVDWNTSDPHLGQSLKHRRVKHYGYEFRYDNNNVDKDSPLTEKIPGECLPVLERILSCGYIEKMPDQLTVNEYEPGQGIPPHVDTHSAFEDPIIVLSLGCSVVMDFRHSDGRHFPILLPQRSLTVLSGESRYDWTHGIVPRTMDVIPAAAGNLTVLKRRKRTSFTFRRVRRNDCDCKFRQLCDSYQNKLKHGVLQCDEKLAAKLETLHVHKVYEEIASHFSDTRHKPWPNVLEFVQSFPAGSLVVDVGCGNGKYFGHNSHSFEIGCDHSLNLMKACREKGSEVFSCNCLSLPLRSEIADGCLSIAVIHHLATQERRVQAIQEMVRILRSGGRALIYVWAKEQERNQNKSSYLKQGTKQRRPVCSNAPPNSSSSESQVAVTEQPSVDKQETGEILEIHVEGETCREDSVKLPVHVNRTNFLHQDLFVPWKLKPEAGKKLVKGQDQTDKDTPVFYRFYHVFEEGELDTLCRSFENIKILKSYYDQGNWCVLLEKL